MKLIKFLNEYYKYESFYNKLKNSIFYYSKKLSYHKKNIKSSKIIVC